jgi:predicted NBD/HSP70 family sugar kinase
MRASNLRTCYTLLQEHRQLSRADLARLTGLTRSTISLIVETLLKAGVARPRGFSRRSTGRPAEILDFNPLARFVLGLEVGDTHCTAVLADLDGRPVEVNSGPGSASAPVALTHARDLVSSILTTAVKSKVVGIGAGVPGVVNPQSGVIEIAPDLGWEAVEVGSVLERAFGLPVAVANRAKTAALAEYRRGAGRHYSRLVFISISSGIAAGMVFDGQLYRGATLHEGELGHMVVVPDGPLCRCGNRGCLQALAAIPALLASVRERVRAIGASEFRDRLFRTSDLEALKALAVAAQAGDPMVLDAVDTASKFIGIATANVVNILNPHVVVLGGALPRLIPQVVDRVRDQVRRQAIAAGLDGLEVVASSIGEDAVALGGAALVLSTPTLVDRFTSDTTVAETEAQAG